MPTKKYMPAFPTTDYYDEKPCGVTEGMTLRDYFAAKAMSAWIADGAIGRVCEMDPSKRFAHAYQQVAESSFGIADAMLKERAK